MGWIGSKGSVSARYKSYGGFKGWKQDDKFWKKHLNQTGGWEKNEGFQREFYDQAVARTLLRLNGNRKGKARAAGKNVSKLIPAAKERNKSLAADRETQKAFEKQKTTSGEYKSRSVKYKSSISEVSASAAYARTLDERPKAEEGKQVGGTRRETVVTGRGISSKLGAAAVKTKTLLGGKEEEKKKKYKKKA